MLVPATTRVAPGERFPYEVRNTGSERIGFGEPFRLERLRGQEWERCELRLFFHLPLYVLAPGESKELTAQLPAEFEPGHYRFVKEIHERLPPASDIPAVEVDFEFDVIAPR